jgi:uncharacterized phiE125 gp8 family phage protein
MAKNHLRIPSTITEDDSYVDALIEAAVPVVELLTNRKLMLQEWALHLDEFPQDGGDIEIPFPPLLAVSSVKYYDSTDTEVTLAGTVYQVDNKGLVGVVKLKNNQQWPSTPFEKSNAVTITFTCGYYDPDEDDLTDEQLLKRLPIALRQAILLLVGTWYANRETVIVGTNAMKIPNTIEMLVAPFEVPEIA